MLAFVGSEIFFHFGMLGSPVSGFSVNVSVLFAFISLATEQNGKKCSKSLVLPPP